MKRHLAIFFNNQAEQILTGSKNIDIRFSKKKIAPFSQIAVGDEVLIKIRGAKIIGKFNVAKVIFYDHPTNADLIDIKKKLISQSKMPNNFWQQKEDANYLTLIFIGQSQRFLVSPQIEKKDQRGWVIL